MGVRHVVVFRWTEGTTDDDISAVEAALAGLPAAIPELVDYRFGRDLRVSDGTWDFAVVADFRDQDGYLAYRDHPAHQDVIAEHIRPHLADRAAVQLAT